MTVAECVRELSETNVDTPENIAALAVAVRGAPGNPLEHLWRLATGDNGSEPNQSEEHVVEFYRAFPMLPIFRPLMRCWACKSDEDCSAFPNFMDHRVPMNYTTAIGLVYLEHHWTAAQIADWIGEFRRRANPPAPQAGQGVIR